MLSLARLASLRVTRLLGLGVPLRGMMEDEEESTDDRRRFAGML
jgi:hypothetical protein